MFACTSNLFNQSHSKFPTGIPLLYKSLMWILTFQIFDFKIKKLVLYMRTKHVFQKTDIKELRGYRVTFSIATN